MRVHNRGTSIKRPSSQNDTARSEGKTRTVGAGLGAILLSLIASGHQWAQWVVLMVGIGAVGGGLRRMATQHMFPSYIMDGFIALSLAISLCMLFLGWRARNRSRLSSRMYFASGIVSLVFLSVYLFAK